MVNSEEINTSNISDDVSCISYPNKTNLIVVFLILKRYNFTLFSQIISFHDSPQTFPCLLSLDLTIFQISFRSDMFTSFEQWAAKCHLKETTLDTLRESEIDDLNTVKLLNSEDIRVSNYTNNACNYSIVILY